MTDPISSAPAPVTAAPISDPGPGPKTKPLPLKPITVKGANGEDLYSKLPAIDDLPQAQVTHLDPSYFRYMGSRGVHVNEDIDYQRAKNQNAFEQIGFGIANIVPNIAADTLDLVGQGVNLFTQWGDDRDYENEFTKMGDAIRDFGGVSTVYQKHPGEGFDPGDMGWWVNNASSAISSAIPYVLGGAAIGKVFLKGAEALGALRKGANLMKLAQYAAQGMTAGALSYLGAASGGREVFKRVYQDAFQQGLTQGLSAPDAHARAVHIAAQNASSSVQLETALNTALNTLALAPFFHGAQFNAKQAFSRALSGVEASAADESMFTKAIDKVNSIQYEDTDLAKMYRRQGLYRLRNDAIAMGVQGLNSQFAQQQFIQQGKEGKTHGFLDGFGQMENYLTETMNRKGLTHFLTGALTGFLIPIVSDRIPFHSVPKVGEDGKAVVDADGETVREYVSSRTLGETQHRQLFDSYKDALQADMQWHKDKHAELQGAIAANKPKSEIDRIRGEILDPLHRQYVALGLGEAMANTYDSIAALDNKTPVEQKRAQELETLKQSQDPNDREKAISLESYLERNKGKTEAQIHGYSDGVGDDAYVGKAQEAKELIHKYTDFYNKNDKKYGWIKDIAQTDVVGYLTQLQMTQHLREKYLADDAREIGDLRKTMTESFKADPEAYQKEEGLLNARMSLYERGKVLSARGKELKADQDLMEKAQAVARKGNTSGAVEMMKPLIRKYTGFGATADDVVNSVKKTISTFGDKIKEFNDEQEQTEKAFGGLAGYDEWAAKNEGKGFADFLGHWDKNFNPAIQEQITRIAARQAAHDNLKESLELTKSSIKELDNAKTMKGFVDKAIQQNVQMIKDGEMKKAQDEFDAGIRSSQKQAYSATAKALSSELVSRSSSRVVDQRARVEKLREQVKDYTENFEKKTEGVGRAIAFAQYAELAHRLKLQEEDLAYNEEYHKRLLNEVKQAEAEQAIQAEEAAGPPPGEPDLAPDDVSDGMATAVDVSQAREHMVVKPSEFIDHTFTDAAPRVKIYLDGMMLQVERLSEKRIREWIDGIPGAAGKPIALTEQHKGILTEYIKERMPALRKQAGELKRDILREFVKTFRPADSEFLVDQTFQAMVGEPLDEMEFGKRGLGGMIPIIKSAAPVIDIPERLRVLVDKEASELLDNKEMLGAEFPSNVAGAFVRSNDRADFLEKYFSGRPIPMGVDMKIDPLTLAIGEHNYTTGDSVTEPDFIIDGITPAKIDIAGDRKLLVAEDGSIHLHEDRIISKLGASLPVKDELGTTFTIANHSLAAPKDRVVQVWHNDGDKTVDAFKINTSTLDYKEIFQDDKYQIVNRPTSLDKRFNRNVLKPDFAQAGTGVVLQIDDQYAGPQNFDHELVGKEKQVTFNDHLDDKGKIKLNNVNLGNVPIKIVHAGTGETIGYLPRSEWVRSKYPGASNYRNVAGSDEDIEHQVARIDKIRERLARDWNSGIRGGIQTEVTAKGPGKIITNYKINPKTGKPKLYFERSSKMLPDKELTFGIAEGSTAYRAKGVAMPVSNRELEFNTGNSPVVFLPMANGQHAAAPLIADQLRAEHEVPSMLKFIELHLKLKQGMASALEKSQADRILAESGYDLTKPTELRRLINQFYTYTQSFDAGITAITAASAPGDARTPSFLFNITDSGDIMAGTSYSGIPAVWAKLTKAGTLSKEFVDAFSHGTQSRSRNVVYTDTRSGIKGINHPDPLAVPSFTRSGNLRVDKFGSYNEFVKDFTSTAVYGLHTVDGNHVYSANPQMSLGYPDTEPTRKITSRGPDSPDTGSERAPARVTQKDETSLSDLPDTEGLEGLFGPLKQPRTIKGLAATEQNLKDLRTFTPEGDRSISSVQKDLNNAGTDTIAPEHDPFAQC